MTESTQIPDRRGHPRANFSGITLVHTPTHEIHCVAGNLSESGMLLYPQRPQQIPRAMRVTFALPTVSRWIELEGTLVRDEQDHRRQTWGICFGHVPTDVRYQLRHFVTTYTPCIPRQRVSSPPPIPPPIPPSPDAALERMAQQPLTEAQEPPPIPLEAMEESVSVHPGETTNRMSAKESRFLVASTNPGHEPPTRRTAADEVSSLKNRCRERD